MKNFAYIFLFLVLGLFGKSFGFTQKNLLTEGYKKEAAIKANKQLLHLNHHPDKFTRQKGPKKPKGIKVIVPNVSKVVFKNYFRHSELSVQEVKGDYFVLLHYSHGKRGPPLMI